MTAYTPQRRSGITQAVFSHAVTHCLSVFQLRDAPRCSAVMLWNVLVWAASRTKSLYSTFTATSRFNTISVAR